MRHAGGTLKTLSQRRSAGFTLIEVLVVVAIIALLVAILLPALRKARDQAKSVACKTNLHDFGIAIMQYANDSRGLYPLPSYIGSTIWYDNPGADDNLFVLWHRKYTRNVATFTCPATNHKVRTPERIEKVPVAGKGIEYQIFTGGERRNDFEFHGQLVTQLVQLPSAKTVRVNGYGSSYEYGGWVGSIGTTRVDWYPLNRKATWTGGEPMSTKSFFSIRTAVAGVPATEAPVRRVNASAMLILKDADEGGSTGPDVVGAPPGKAINNIPEPWDNHGAKYSNVLYGDMHVETQGVGYWEKYIRENGLN